MDARTSEFYEKNAAEATRPTKKAATLGTATTKPSLELPWVLPVWLGEGLPVELEWEEGEVDILLLLLWGRLEEEPEGWEEGPEEEDMAEELLLPLLRRLPVPQAMLSPFGWVVWGGGVLLPSWSVMVNLVVQYFWVEEEVLNS